MKELNNIIAAFAKIQHNNEQVFLATVVNAQGSTYRQPGARMLITSSGKMVGTISGGCLENDVFEHTRVSMPDGKPIVITYDTTADEDIIWGFGLGCNGVVNVFIELLNQDNPLNPLAFIHQCFYNQQQGIIATVIAVEGRVNVKVGARLILQSNNTVNTDIKDEYLTAALLKDAQAALENQHSSFHQYQLAVGKVDIFIELIKPPPHLIIFGAGRDSVPVAEFAKALGWRVTIVDCRGSEVTQERFIMADQVILTRREILDKQICIDDNTIAVVMTHNYLDDLEILKVLIPAAISYLGCLGSKQRTARLLQDLRAAGVECTPIQLQKLHTPVGIDIGADTPEAIALSIIAEIQAVLANRGGGFLKHRMEPIHKRNQVNKIPIKNYKGC
ncbi:MULTISPECIES: XdhC/CoxI family protein [Moorena]|uniref:Xanthine and CO dehydrogenase maturation factor, XdhC/CoxF family n=1 Tax=Moorena producens 3L TaxID=489825 RepID=F4XSK2_9CYAN|nr:MULTISPECIES: XdhC/CoxI family protein [Moorena]NEQ17214.1 XdhC family protein [Moorena sp. SIO3E2]EGJ32415.1 Xanthine and CO dehydrogenase maturation factor, XdhC/CoxF family [Moorena producens 3L]NEP35823.1 XdhC family protein [Moorena sp. SIO3B2]NEP69852.1 XdhC family protein [Moorena sp. SIO3A5]NEQ07677.1 XdhC family protein [Moorena sp. SIO4E2]